MVECVPKGAGNTELPRKRSGIRDCSPELDVEGGKVSSQPLLSPPGAFKSLYSKLMHQMQRPGLRECTVPNWSREGEELQDSYTLDFLRIDLRDWKAIVLLWQASIH